MGSPTQAEIAERLGVSKMTVSRALRGERHVREELRDQVREVAREMGYRPDPEVARMMAHLRRTREARREQALGFVWTDQTAEKTTAWARSLVEGARAKAEGLGYRLDEFSIRRGGMSARRVAEVMAHRGIRGFVLSPLISRSRGHLNMPWEQFSCVMIGMGYARPILDRVHHHHFMGMMTCLRQLRKEGHRRVGFFTGSQIDRRMFGAWSASFLAHHSLPMKEARALLRLPKQPTRAEFEVWVEKVKPEVVLTAGTQIVPWVGALPRERRPEVAMLAWDADRAEIAGLDQQSDVLGGTAVELVVDRIHRNERGIPEHPKMVMTAGVWRAGAKTGGGKRK
jgi:DNA-binding LacI/PurR family transcriptional regulator